jgi:hypothetical protein
MERKKAHLEMILGVVNRLSQNSFLLKGWCVVLISALFALSANDTNPLFIYVAYFPAIVFWILDAHFLWQERLFRALYDHVRTLDDEEIDFSMDTSIVRSSVSAWSDVILSKTLAMFHGTVIVTIIVVMFFLLRTKGGQ